jgi:hypothetical protein
MSRGEKHCLSLEAFPARKLGLNMVSQTRNSIADIWGDRHPFEGDEQRSISTVAIALGELF